MCRFAAGMRLHVSCAIDLSGCERACQAHTLVDGRVDTHADEFGLQEVAISPEQSNLHQNLRHNLQTRVSRRKVEH
jgi:hypothetical protein